MFLVSGWHTCESLEASVTLVRGPPPIVLTGAAPCEAQGEECQTRPRDGDCHWSSGTSSWSVITSGVDWSRVRNWWQNIPLSLVLVLVSKIKIPLAAHWDCAECIVCCWWRRRSIYNSIVRVFLFPFSPLLLTPAGDHGGLLSSSYTSSDNVSLSGKISNASTPGDLKLTVRTNLRLTRGDHYLWATLVLVVHQALNWAQWMKLIMQDWN